MKEKTKHLLLLLSVFFAVLIIVGLSPFMKNVSAASLKISYNGNTINFKNQIISVSIDGESLPAGEDPLGLELVNSKNDERYMVSLMDVFADGMDAYVTYDEPSGAITLSLYDTTIEMTLNNKYAMVNNVKQKMPFEPIEVTFMNTGNKKIMVDSEFIIKALGFGYSWKNNSSTSGSVFITSPSLYTYNNNTHVYTDTDWTLTYDDKVIKLPRGIKTPHIEEVLYVPLKKVFSVKAGADYSYNSTDKKITLIKNGVTLTMTVNSTEAAINGDALTLNHAPYLVTWQEYGSSCIMVPLMQVSSLLNFDCSIDDLNHKGNITRKDTVYNEWDTVNPASKEYKNLIKVSATRVNKEDILCFYTDKKPLYEVRETKTKIVLTLKRTVSQVGELDYTQEDPYLFKSINITQKTPKRTVVTIYKKKNKDYSVYSLNKTKGYVKISIINKDVIRDDRIKIAIDCGHGNDTPGKRTPPMPFDIDIDGDGKIDIKKGTQYREHYASVGVGNYLYKALVRCNFQVYKSAFGAEDVPLVTRQSNIKAEKCDYSVCIHWNAIGDGRSFNSTEGLGVYYYSQPAYAGDSKNFASILQKNLMQGTPQKDRGIDGQNQYAMCNCKFLGTKASVLIELAFMTNQKEATKMMANEKYWKESAEEICRGICEYTGVKYIEP